MIEIELNNINKNYGLKNILNGVSFEVKTGEKIALIGGNGSGKSTILKIIGQEEKVDSGKINIRKESNIGYLKQVYSNEKIDIRVEEYLKKSFKKYADIEEKMKKIEALMKETSQDLEKIIKKYGKLQEEYISFGGYELEEKLKKMCSCFNFNKEFLNKTYNSLSGGEKTIVNLATILLKEPDILLLDEPTNHLDVESLEWLENFLILYKGTILLISHDRCFLDKVVNKTIFLENGKVDVFFGNYSYFVNENEKRTLAKFEKYKNQQKQIEKMKESIKQLRNFGQFEQNESFFKRARCIEKRLEKMEKLEKVTLEKRKIPLKINAISRSGKEVLIIKNLNKKYGEKIIFNNFNMEIYYGEKIRLAGKNGSGKSTLIKMILGKDLNYTGNIKISSSAKIGYIPQEIKFENEKETVFDYFSKKYNKSQTEIRTYLAKYMFTGKNVFKRLEELSGGERVRLLFAKMEIMETNFLILDEPTNHLDILMREVIEENLKEYKGTILFVSHDRYFTNKLVQREIVI